jgi:hypothetical protein
VSGAPWLIITGSGLDYRIYWQLLLQCLIFTINYSAIANLPTTQITRTRYPFPGNGFITGTITSNHYSSCHFLFSYLGMPILQNSTLILKSLLAESESDSCVSTDGHSATVSWNKAPIWGLGPDFYYCQTVAGSLMWGALSDERKGLSFTITAGPRQPSHSRVRVPCDSRPYFTVSDSRLPFSSPPTTRRAMVEVFDPASSCYKQTLVTKPRQGPHRRHLLVLGMRVYSIGHGADHIENISSVVRIVVLPNNELYHGPQEHSSHCCLFSGTCILSRCLAVGPYVTVLNISAFEVLRSQLGDFCCSIHPTICTG